MTSGLFKRISKSNPALKVKLKRAGLDYSPEEFVKRTFLSAFYMAAGIIIFLFLILAKINLINGLFFASIPIIFLMMLSYMMRYPDAKIFKIEREINKEILFAGRFLVIEIESGVSLYNAMSHIHKNYKSIGKYFKDITDKVALGTPMEVALNQAVEIVPSDDLRRIFWQIINSMRTGSNISKSISSVLDQITREQIIQVDKYGKKLNPLAMFYMMVSVIIPSLGVTMLVILSSFIQLEINLTVLIIVAVFIGFVQFMFISVVKFSRPAVEF